MALDSYELAKKIVAFDDGASNFSDPDGELAEMTLGAVHFAAQICGCTPQEIRDQCTEIAQDDDAVERENDELQYGDLDEYGEPRQTPDAD